MPKLPAWVAKPFWKLEGASLKFLQMCSIHTWLRVCSAGDSALWLAVLFCAYMCCAVAFWLFYILIGIPMLISYACLCKGFQVDASKGFRFIVPQNCYLLYDRCTGAIEAPVTAALLVMLLVVGVRRENGYVISYPQVL